MTKILGPEGYCGRCAFVVGLDHTGMLSHHWRGRHGGQFGAGSACPGGGRPAWKRTPYYSEKAAFRTTGGETTCPWCLTRISVRVSVISGTRFRPHSGISGIRDCPGSNQLIKGAERLPLSAVR
jgi:hypothetical protein